MASIISESSDGITNKGVEFFERFKDGFGNVVKAKMKANECTYVLTLENDRGEIMELKNSCTAGYYGTGCGGTLKVLKACGFNVDREFIGQNEEFEITK